MAAAAVLLLAACSSVPAGLRLPGHVSDGAGISQDSVPVGRPVTFGSMVVCNAASSPTTVTSVGLRDVTGDLALQRFAVRPYAPDVAEPIGVGTGSLTDAVPGVTPGPATVADCGAGMQGSELLVEVTRSGPADGCARGGLDVSWSNAEGAGTLVVPLALGVAAGSPAPPCP